MFIKDKYLYPTWIKDGLLEKGKLLQTSRLSKKMNSVFFPRSLCMILLQKLLSGMNFLKIPDAYHKTFLFYCYPDLEKDVFPSALQDCFHFFFLPSLFIVSTIHSSHAAF